jgi:hypothetical protein
MAGRDDVDVAQCIVDLMKRVHNNKQTPNPVEAKRKPTVFLLAVIHIIDRESLRITKNRRSALKAHLMILEILPGFPRVPREQIAQLPTSTRS